jgi:type IV pilus assembly protein PilM
VLGRKSKKASDREGLFQFDFEFDDADYSQQLAAMQADDEPAPPPNPSPAPTPSTAQPSADTFAEALPDDAHDEPSFSFLTPDSASDAHDAEDEEPADPYAADDSPSVPAEFEATAEQNPPSDPVTEAQLAIPMTAALPPQQPPLPAYLLQNTPRADASEPPAQTQTQTQTPLSSSSAKPSWFSRLWKRLQTQASDETEARDALPEPDASAELSAEVESSEPEPIGAPDTDAGTGAEVAAPSDDESVVDVDFDAAIPMPDTEPEPIVPDAETDPDPEVSASPDVDGDFAGAIPMPDAEPEPIGDPNTETDTDAEYDSVVDVDLDHTDGQNYVLDAPAEDHSQATPRPSVADADTPKPAGWGLFKRKRFESLVDVYDEARVSRSPILRALKRLSSAARPNTTAVSQDQASPEEDTQPAPEPDTTTTAVAGGTPPMPTGDLPLPEPERAETSSVSERSPILRLIRRTSNVRARKQKKIKVDETGQPVSKVKFGRRQPEPEVHVDADGNIVTARSDAPPKQSPFGGPASLAKRLSRANDTQAKATAAAPQQADEVRAARKQRFGFLRRRQNVVGLHIGATSIRAVMISHGQTVLSADMPLPPGTIVDGLLEQPKALTQTIERLWKQERIRAKLVNFSFVNRNVALKTVSLPAAARPEDLELAIRHKADTELAPMNTSNSIVDYTELTRSGRNVSYLLAAADKRMVSRFVQAVEAANLIAVACEITPLAAVRALRVPRDPTAAQMIIDIGAETTTVVCASGPDVLFLRIVNIAGNDFTREISQRLGFDWSAAEQMKKASGLGLTAADAALDDTPQFNAAQEALLTVADRLAQELAATRTYYENQPQGRRITGVTLTGGASAMPGLREEISNALGLQANVTPDANPAIADVPDFDEMHVAAGLALGHTMSFLPEGKARGRMNVTLPGVRTRSRLSKRRTNVNVRRLRRNGQQKKISAQTIALLAGVAMITGGYIYSNRVRDEIEPLRDRVTQMQAAVQAQRNEAVAPQYQPTSEAASLTLGTLLTKPNTASLPAVMNHLESTDLRDVLVTIEGPLMRVDGIAGGEAVLEQLTAGLRSVPGVSEAMPPRRSLTPHGVKFTFTLILRQQLPRP